MEIDCRKWCNVYLIHGEEACEDDRCPNVDQEFLKNLSHISELDIKNFMKKGEKRK